ncbi:MAG: hypothetical protein ACYSW8_10170 [Planctomycetota bacterium]|jgi:hypothetical protein
MIKRFSVFSAAIIVALGGASHGEQVYRPVIDGPWWQVAGDPDLGEYTRGKQQPVDFGVWQASDGTWQLWSCIRHTGCGGNTRLFYRWQGGKLTDTDWKPMGIAQTARTDLGETLGGQQAPHVVKEGDLYYMAYGDWVNICFSTSIDGKKFTRVIQPGGKTGVFSEGPGLNSRDAMLLKTGGLWYCYYTGHTRERGYDFCRTTDDLSSYKWSHSSVVAYGGRSGDYRWSAECPHVVELSPGNYYLFRTQRYGKNAQTSVYHSTNPLNFGIDDDRGFICTLPVAAPEIILHNGQYYIASLMPSLKGIHIAKLKWIEPKDKLGRAVFDFDNAETRAKWKVKEGNLPAVFTTSTRSNFAPVSRYFIATSETPGGKLNDDLTGVIESPVFTIEDDGYVLLVSGGSELGPVYVTLVEAEANKELIYFAGKQSNRFETEYIDSRQWKRKKVFIRIVDKARGGWGHINFGGIYHSTSDEP